MRGGSPYKFVRDKLRFVMEIDGFPYIGLSIVVKQGIEKWRLLD